MSFSWSEVDSEFIYTQYMLFSVNSVLHLSHSRLNIHGLIFSAFSFQATSHFDRPATEYFNATGMPYYKPQLTAVIN